MLRHNQLWIGAIALLAAVVYLAGQAGQHPPSVRPPTGAPPTLEPLQQLEALIRQKYVDPVDQNKLVEAAARGMIRSLDDHSDYLAPDQAPMIEAVTEGQFSGIGVELAPRDGRPVVISRYDGSPAAHAGILPGDVLLSVNDDPVETMSRDELTIALAGADGAPIALTLYRPSEGRQYRVAVARRTVEPATVRGWRMQADGAWDWFIDPQRRIGYVRITRFIPNTADRLRDAMQQLTRRHANAIVLDLRFNPGGHYQSAIDAADLFLDEGVIVGRRDRSGEVVYSSAKSPGTLPPLPMIVLVNRFSASAAEILAGALRDHGRAQLVGERTWGKATVQTLYTLDELAGTIRLTTARYVLPSGRDIQRPPGAEALSSDWGVKPNVPVLTTSEHSAALLNTWESLDADAIRRREDALATRPATQPTEDLVATAARDRLLAVDEPLAIAVEQLAYHLNFPATQRAE